MMLPEEGIQSPGQQLSAARKQQGKTLVQIAAATRIFETRLEAIERDDYSSAGPAPAFVIGYVKAYAKQVGVNEKPLVSVVEAHFKQKKLAAERENPVVQQRKSLNWAPWLATAVALAIFLGLGQWFFAQQQDELADEKNVEVGAVITPPAMASEPVADTQEEIVPLTQRDENLISRSLVASVAANKDAENKTALKAEVITTESPKNEQSDPPAETGILQESDETQLTSDADLDPASDVLKLTFSHDCWVEIVDANGQKRVAKLAKNGDQIELVGRAPFDLKLGDATAVQGLVNGRPLELTARPGRRVLRIQVGP